MSEEQLSDFPWGPAFTIGWEHIFDVNNIVYIIGGAGYGKSMFLKYMIGQYENMNVLDAKNYIVIYGQLRDYHRADQGRTNSLLDYLQQCMIISTGLDDSQLSKPFITDCLNEGRCIILLDALDEVPRDEREELHQKIITFFKDKHPNNKICITTRSRGFVPQKDVHPFKILPINNKQVEEYVDKMIKLRCFSEEDKPLFLKQASKLINERFLSSFLTLSLLVSIFKAENELPDTKLELYQKCFEYIAKKREMEKALVSIGH